MEEILPNGRYGCQEGIYGLCRCYTISSPLTFKRKCHHEGDGDIEQEGTEEVVGVQSGGDGEDEGVGSSFPIKLRPHKIIIALTPHFSVVEWNCEQDNRGEI